MTTETVKEPQKADCHPRLVRDLTGITPRKRDKILRMIEKLEDELDDNGLVMFGGNCNDDAILMHRETGIVLGHVGNYGVFMGGDLPLSFTDDDIEYSRDLSPTSGNFANDKDLARRALDSE